MGMFQGASESPAPPSFIPTRRWPPRFGFGAAAAAAVPTKPGTARTTPAAAERSRSSRLVKPSLMLLPLSVTRSRLLTVGRAYEPVKRLQVGSLPSFRQRGRRASRRERAGVCDRPRLAVDDPVGDELAER